MSWITGLADKAENILNKIDKNAATALQVPVGSSPNPGTEFMRRSLSSSTTSLKSMVSPTKSMQYGTDSVKSENITRTDSMNTKDNVSWYLQSEKSSPRRNSLKSNEEEFGGIDTSQSENDTISTKVAVPQSIISPSTVSKSSSATGNQELIAFKIALAEVTSERDELRLRLSALNRDVESAGLKQRLRELELLLQSLTEERDQAQRELATSQTASSAYVHSISELETTLAKLQQTSFEVSQKLQMQTRENELQQKELQEYRIKAQRALAMKDNLIAELKANAGISTSSDDSELRVLQIEFDALKQEHRQLLEENKNMTLQLNESQHDWNALRSQYEEKLNSLRTKEDELRKELRLERERSLAIESEQRVLVQELDTQRQQLSNHMAAAATRLQEKEQQLQQLREEYRGRRAGHAFGDNYEERIKALTAALVEKQNSVENITAERNALRIQLEKMQDQIQHSAYNHGIVNNTPRNALLSNSTDDVKAQFPLLLKENPFDNRVARRMKRAYSSLDSAGIRLGAFLRRYPLMRVFVLMYVGLLHLWVMFVLLSSTPN